MATQPTPVSDPRNTTILSGSRAIQLATQNVQPPTPLYLQVEDSLQLQLRLPTAPALQQVTLLLRWMLPNGEIKTIKKSPFTFLDGQTFTFTLGEGFLLSATLVVGSGTGVGTGAWFATLVILRDTPENIGFDWVLFSDYATASHYPSWPFGAAKSPTDGIGRLRSIIGATPAPGADISEVVPNNVRWRLLAFRAVLSNSATVASRQLTLTLDDGANIFFKRISGFVQTAGIVYDYEWIPTGPLIVAANGQEIAPIPQDTFLAPGFHIRTLTSGIQVGDQWAAPQYLVQEWIDV